MTAKVMIVDDSAMMRMIVKSIVDKHPVFNVVTHAGNGKQAAGRIAEASRA